MSSGIKVILEGGLGNRMRVAAAAYTLAREWNIPMQVLWTDQWGMRCRLDSLFLPFDEGQGEHICADDPRVVIRDAEGSERWFYARPRWRNLWLPRLAQRWKFKDIIDSPQIYYLQREGFDFECWFRQGNVLMFAYRDFYPWQPEVLARLFRPTPAILYRTEERCAAFTSHTIGVHIRRTDNIQSIQESPTELFCELIDKHIGMYADTNVYLATDDEPTKDSLLQRYGRRIITSSAHASRESTDGIQEGLVEMLALSYTSHIYGSAGSTFSEIAAKWGSKPYTVVRKGSPNH